MEYQVKGKIMKKYLIYIAAIFITFNSFAENNSTINFDGNNKSSYIKRFKLETTTVDKKFLFISDSKNSKLLTVTDNYSPNVQIKHKSDGKSNETNIIPIGSIVDVRGWKAIGSKLNYSKIVDIQFIETEENDSLETTETEVINYSSNINADNDSKEVEDGEDNDEENEEEGIELIFDLDGNFVKINQD